MMKPPPVIGITYSSFHDSARTSGEPGRWSAYVEAVSNSGAIPLLVPTNSLGENARWLMAHLGAIILSGGGDIHPRFYGDSPRCLLQEMDIERDRFEIALAREAIRCRKPFLGICRGLQVFNIALGGSLIQDIASEWPGALPHERIRQTEETTHPVNIDPASTLYRLLKQTRIETNSSHHQAAGELAPGLEAAARAADGIIEAVELRGHPFGLAVQWHPERMPAHAGSKALFRALTEAAHR